MNLRLIFKGTNGSEALFLYRQQDIQLVICHSSHRKSHVEHCINFMAPNSQLVGK